MERSHQRYLFLHKFFNNFFDLDGTASPKLEAVGLDHRIDYYP